MVSPHLNQAMKFSFIALVLFSQSLFAKPLTPISPEEIVARVAELAPTVWDGKASNKGTTKENGCLMATYTIQVADPKTGITKSLDLLVQTPESKTPLPVVVIVPTIDGTREFLEPRVARDLCIGKIASIIADVNDVRQPEKYPAWGAEDINMRWSMLALRTVVDFAQSVPRFDPTKVGALGLSLGGITTTMFASIEDRLKASVIIVGGGNLPYTLSICNEGRMETLREQRMKATGMKTREEYEDKLRETVNFDPFYFVSPARRLSVMMVMAEADDKVPYLSQHETWEGFGKPASLTFAGGHVSTILSMVYLYMSDVRGFYNKKFNPAPAPFLETEPQITHKVVDLDSLGL